MKEVSRAVLDAVTAELKPYEKFATVGAQNVLSNAAAELGIDPDGFVDMRKLQNLRDLAAEIVNETTQMCAQNVGAISADFAQAVTGSSIAPSAAANTSSFTPDRREIEKKMHAAIGDVMSGKKTVSQFVTEASRYGGKMVAETHYRALDRMTKGNVRWARVPSGAETCKFCVMLASRDAVYHTAKAAGEHYHANCDCRVVCGPYDPKLKRGVVNVEGYDSGKYLQDWKDDVERRARKSAADNGTTYRTERVLTLAGDAVTAKAADFSDRLIAELFDGLGGYTESQKRDIFEAMLTREIPATKIDRYALLDENKSKAFKAALGYDSETSDELVLQIFQRSSEGEMELVGNNGYGDMYRQRVTFTGPNGKSANVIIAWIDKPENSKMSLTSCYVKGKK